jgi:hypothetical protein
MAFGTGSILEPPRPARKVLWRPAEVAVTIAVFAMSIIAWMHPQALPFSLGASHFTVALMFAVAALALGEERSGWRYWCRELLPLPIVPYLFLSLGKLIPVVNPSICDDLLIAWDRALLGKEAQAALYAIPLPPWAADMLTLAYSSFFFLPVALAVSLAWRHDPVLPRVSSAILFTFLLSYIGYFFVPAHGPRATVALERYTALPPGLVGEPLRDLLDTMEKTKTDAFPSGHTMVTLVTLYCARRRWRTLYNILLPIGTLLIAATMLLTYHYVVDVLAAIPFDIAALALSAWLSGPVPRGEPATVAAPH